MEGSKEATISSLVRAERKGSSCVYANALPAGQEQTCKIILINELDLWPRMLYSNEMEYINM